MKDQLKIHGKFKIAVTTIVLVFMIFASAPIKTEAIFGLDLGSLFGIGSSLFGGGGGSLTWVSTGGKCYKGNGVGGVGSTRIAPSCNSGYKLQFFPYPTPVWIPIFLSDCGPGGALCDSASFGCLNSVCKNSGNAIWDATTGICGCG